jgi:uncharacterized membrane protein
MRRRPHNERILRDKDRFEAFSDGVFAIAATLLVADLKVPIGLTGTGTGLGRALVANWPSYLAFVLSFMTVVIFWGNHHQAFKHIRYTDAIFLVLNGLLLMVIAFVPHAASVLSDYLLDPGQARVATAFYAVTLFAAAVGVNLLWGYAVRHPDLLIEDADSSEIQFHSRHLRLSLFLRALTIVLAFVSVPFSLVALVLVSLYYLVPRG